VSLPRVIQLLIDTGGVEEIPSPPIMKTHNLNFSRSIELVCAFNPVVCAQSLANRYQTFKGYNVVSGTLFEVV